MGRPETEIPPEKLASATADWRAGVLSLSAIAIRYGIPFYVLKRRLKGITQDGTATTRAMVSAKIAGVPNPEIDAAVAGTVGVGVAIALDAMVTADQIFRNILKIVSDKTAVKGVLYQPKDLKDLVSAAKDAMEGVRRVRELDGPTEKEIQKIEIEFIRARPE
jgi:hypothetical protein